MKSTALVANFCKILTQKTDAWDRVRQCYDTLTAYVKQYVSGNTRADRYGDINELKQEANTWRLIETVYKDRWSTTTQEFPQIMIGSSDKDIHDNLVQQNAELRRSMMIVEWLEEIAFNELDKLDGQMSETAAWSYTLGKLKKRPQTHSRPAVSEMDPDAPLRSGLILDDRDARVDATLMKKVFILLRAGCLDQAITLCQDVGQYWRAGTLEGWRLWHDPNASSIERRRQTMQEILPFEGNWNRDVWKDVCLKMVAASETPGNTQYGCYELATYALLSGSKALLTLKTDAGQPVCPSWEDELWAYFRLMVDVQVEQELRANGNPLRHDPPSLPEWYLQSSELSPQVILTRLESSTSDIVRQGSREIYHIVQSLLILGNVTELIQNLNQWSAREPNTGELVTPANQGYLRFFAHLVIFLRTVNTMSLDLLQQCDAIVYSYVLFLVSSNSKVTNDALATYVAALPQEQEIAAYSTALLDVRDKDSRKYFLRLAVEAGLNVPKITMAVVTQIRLRGGQYGVAQTPDTTSFDTEKIEAIDWLLFDSTQAAEALLQCNAIARSFLVYGKIDATRRLFQRINETCDPWPVKQSDTNAMKEYLCFEAYLEAKEAFESWTFHFHNCRPIDPSLNTSYRASHDGLRDSLQQDINTRRFQTDLQRWTVLAKTKKENAQTKIVNVLTYQTRWLVDVTSDASIPEYPQPQRQVELQEIRARCIPELCRLLHTVYFDTGDYSGSLRIADIVASSRHGLLEVFQFAPKEDLRNFLSLMRKSALKNLDSHNDPILPAIP